MNIFLARVEGRRAILEAEESWHCARVLRKRAGEQLRLTDGQGNFYDAVLELVGDRQCVLSITSGPQAQAKRNYRLHLAISPTKQLDRIEWMVEKAVEIGIDELSFVFCKNSERTVIKTERISKIVLSAVKQSLQAWLPRVNEPVKLNELLENADEEQKLICHCGDGDKQEIRKTRFSGKRTLVLVGPEGDFTREETDAARAKGFIPLSLGSTRLRTETAGLYAVQAASLL